jgi:hypothetical protein
MKITNIQFKYILLAVSAVVAIILVIVAIIWYVGSLDANQNDTTSLIKQGDDLKAEAVRVMASDPASARPIMERALEKYTKSNDTDNIIDVQAQLSIIDYEVSNR